MTKRDVLEIVCRGIALLLAVWAVRPFVEGLTALYHWRPMQFAGEMGDPYFESLAIVSFSGTVLYILLGLWLWKGAPWIAKRATGGTSSEAAPAGVTAKDLRSVAFAGVGIYFFASGLVRVGSFLIVLFTRNEEFKYGLVWAFTNVGSVPDWVDGLVRMTVGLVLVIGPRRLWTAVWAGVRAAAEWFWNAPKQRSDEDQAS